ncbi:MAG: Unknown protein [uncultured Sulfurovum sp.]|uniref:Lcl C-terminal domain-containing protein n=1 Tax=uncultured Sulfurovum sp. TaxID=269237 RepID=A0A6S6TLV9_9BACT|nr:MAG: Unknown protein [uncultured Sulfurovum sp.]
MIGMSSFINASSFSRANGVVNDSSTNLEWQDDYTDNNNMIKETTWENAIDYCETLTLDTKNDWRLPNLNELTSLVDDTKHNPSLNSLFENTNSNNYWSSTSPSDTNEDAWIVNFYYGFQDGNDKSFNSYVRCVRAGQ